MIACLRIGLLLLAGCLAAGAARAHEVRPAYLDIAQTGEQVYAVIWKQPVLGDRILRLEPVFPEECVRSAEAA